MDRLSMSQASHTKECIEPAFADSNVKSKVNQTQVSDAPEINSHKHFMREPSNFRRPLMPPSVPTRPVAVRCCQTGQIKAHSAASPNHISYILICQTTASLLRYPLQFLSHFSINVFCQCLTKKKTLLPKVECKK